MHFNNPTSGPPRHYSKSYGRGGAGSSSRILSGTRTFPTISRRRVPPVLSNPPNPRDEKKLSPRHAPYSEVIRALPSSSSSNVSTPATGSRFKSSSSVQTTTSNIFSASTSTPVRTRHDIRPPLIHSKCEIRSPMNNISAAANEICSMSPGEIRPSPRISNRENNASHYNLSNPSLGGRVSSFETRPSYTPFETRPSCPMIVPRDLEEKENASTFGNTSNERYKSYALETRLSHNSRVDSQWSRSMSSSLSSSNDDTNSGTVGLINLGNTCFMNAALQAIAHTPSLARYFLSNKYREANTNEDKLASSFAEVVRAIYRSSPSGSRRLSVTRALPFRPQKFLEDLIEVAPQFDGGRQREYKPTYGFYLHENSDKLPFQLDDCHEFIRVLIDQLSEDLCISDKPQRNQQTADLDDMSFLQAANFTWKQHLAMNSSFITDEFCGQLVSTLQCSHCGSKRVTFDPFYDLSVPFPVHSSSDEAPQRRYSRCSFMQRLNDNDAVSSCDLDNCLRAFTEPEILTGDNMPECTTCHQKRESSKRLQVYRFPRVLVLHLKRFGNDRKKIRTSVQFPITNFNASALAIDNEHRPANAPVYDLFATCEHSGRMNFGHYTATCLDSVSNQFYDFNDDHVSSFDPEKIDNSSVYVLFYKQAN